MQWQSLWLHLWLMSWRMNHRHLLCCVVNVQIVNKRKMIFFLGWNEVWSSVIADYLEISVETCYDSEIESYLLDSLQKGTFAGYDVCAKALFGLERCYSGIYHITHTQPSSHQFITFTSHIYTNDRSSKDATQAYNNTNDPSLTKCSIFSFIH